MKRTTKKSSPRHTKSPLRKGIGFALVHLHRPHRPVGRRGDIPNNWSAYAGAGASASVTEKQSDMKKILILLMFAGIFCQASAQIQQPKPKQKIQSCFTWYDAGSFGFAVSSGISHGIIEALRKDQGSLQHYLNVGDYDFGGKNDWERNYVSNRYRNENGSINPHKSEVLGNFGRDAWHTAGDVAKWSDRFGSALFITGAALDICRTSKLEYPSISARKKAVRRKVWGYVAKGATLWAVSSIVENNTFQSIIYSN